MTILRISLYRQQCMKACHGLCVFTNGSDTLHLELFEPKTKVKPDHKLLFTRTLCTQMTKCTNKVPLLINQENLKQVTKNFDTFLLDCDGVLWATDHYTKFDQISMALEKLKDEGKEILFVTNNSMHSRKSLLEKIHAYTGYEADIEDIFSVSYVAAKCIKNRISEQARCYMIGTGGMQEELNSVGVEVFGFGADQDLSSDEKDDLLKHELQSNVEAVLVGFDHHFSYNKLLKAASYLKEPSCHYFATSDLEICVRIGPRHVQPLTGVFVAAVSVAAKRQPYVIGKPYWDILKCIQTKKNLDLTRTIMIGDSLAADIHFASNSNIKSMLILTGASTTENVQTAIDMQNNHLIPDFILPEFKNFTEYL